MTSIPDLRNTIIAQLGYTSLLGDPIGYADLSADQQIAVTNAMEAYIAANPSEFTDAQAALSTQSQAAGGIASTTTYGLSDQANDFFGEVGNQITSLNNNLNPFSEQNRKYFYYIILFAAAVWFLGPKIAEIIKKSK